MAEWQYSKIRSQRPPRTTTEIDILNRAGEEGWELVIMTGNNIAYLKRPVGEEPQSPSEHFTLRPRALQFGAA
jgi:hypothetical protein